MKVAVIGAGSFGTALALILNRNGVPLCLWGHDPLQAEKIRTTRENAKYLPGFPIPPEIEVTSDLNQALSRSDIGLLVVPSHAFKQILSQMAQSAGASSLKGLISATKGIERDTGRRMSELMSATFPGLPVAALSGPTLAVELAKGVPTAVVVASPDQAFAELCQKLFACSRFRTYWSTDIVGVELGGALKNVIALASGICDGLGFGDNSKAALMTRGLAEICRLATACGAQRDTLTGLSGMGDLIVTCMSQKSRNRSLGERIGKGETLEAILKEMTMVAEGVKTSESASLLAVEKRIETPIILSVYNILYKGQNVVESMGALLSRDMKNE